MGNLQFFIKKIKDYFKPFFQQRHEKLLKDYQELAQAHADDMRIRIKIAETYFKASQIDKAIETYLDIAQIYTEQNFILKTTSMYKTILKLDPTLVEMNLKLAELYMKLDMVPDAANQYRIAMQVFGMRGDRDKLIDICQKLVKTDPSLINLRKLAEIYQALGLTDQAIEQYEVLAKKLNQLKKYDDLLQIYELILAHKSDNPARIRDACILYLRKQQPDHAMRLVERHRLEGEAAFVELYEKAKLMRKTLRAKKPA